MKNPYAARWQDIHSTSLPHGHELVRLEVEDAESREVETCGKCGSDAYYRPGVGAYNCPNCQAVLIMRTGEWR